MENDIKDVQIMVKATVDVRFITFDLLIEKLKEIRGSYPSETRVAGIANLSIYYNKNEGGAK